MTRSTFKALRARCRAAARDTGYLDPDGYLFDLIGRYGRRFGWSGAYQLLREFSRKPTMAQFQFDAVWSGKFDDALCGIHDPVKRAELVASAAIARAIPSRYQRAACLKALVLSITAYNIAQVEAERQRWRAYDQQAHTAAIAAGDFGFGKSFDSVFTNAA